MKWFRLYDEVIDDPKVMRLPIEWRWRWIEFMCIASRQPRRGTLPPVEDMEYHLRCSAVEIQERITYLSKQGLVDREGKTWVMHGWDSRQFKSDDVTARTAKHKKGLRSHGNVPGNVPGNGPETEAEAEQSSSPPTPREIHDTNSPKAVEVVAEAGRRWGEIDLDAEVQANELIRSWGAELAGKALDKAFRTLGSKQKPWHYANSVCQGGLNPSGNGKPRKDEPVPEYIPPVTDLKAVYGPKYEPKAKGRPA